MTERSEQIERLNATLIACKTCDALWRRPHLAPGERARCPRCHDIIAANKPRGVERTTALMLASILVYIVAVTFPFMSMERSGLSNEISVLNAITVLWHNDMGLLAALTAFLILLFPATRVLLLLLMHSALHRGQSMRRQHAWLLRWAESLEPWAMADIFMIGVIVSLVKVGDLANIGVGPAFWAMSALIVFMAMGTSATCRDTAWSALRERP